MLPHVKEPWKLGRGLGTDPFCHLVKEQGPLTPSLQTFGLRSCEIERDCSSGLCCSRPFVTQPRTLCSYSHGSSGAERPLGVVPVESGARSLNFLIHQSLGVGSPPLPPHLRDLTRVRGSGSFLWPLKPSAADIPARARRLRKMTYLP